MTTERAVPGFLPSTSGLHFPNQWPAGTPALRWRVRVPGPVPIAAELAVGDAGDGLCGGMALAVVDLWTARGTPPADREPPAPGTRAFDYLVRRQIDSLRWGLTVADFYRLAATTDRGRARATVRSAWPGIRSDLDRERPSIVGLVHVASLDPRRLTANHQVVAYRYALDPPAGSLTLAIYDPNRPDDDTALLRLQLTGNGTGISIVYEAWGSPIVALCTLPYAPHDPEVLSSMNP